MAKVDDRSTSGTSLADDGTDSVTVTSSGADVAYVFIDDDNTGGTVGDHAGYELTIEVKGDVDGTDRFQEYATVGGDGTDAETARSWRFQSVDDEMKFTLTNRSGSAADYGMRAVTVAYNG